MKADIFVTIQKLKNKVVLWRALTFICIFFSLVMLGGKILKSSVVDKNIIARVKISDYIENGTFSKEKMNELKNDSVKAVILDIDSQGGDVVASEVLYNFFRKLATEKPVISKIEGMGASGAYLVAMASDYIIAHNTSVVGSIGVLVQTYEITELAKKMGISLTSYKSSPLKAAPNPFEKVTPDVDMIISQEINDIYDYFLTIFVERRKIKITEAQEIANGQIYTGRQALDYGLIDKIGGDDEVMEYFKDIDIDINKVKIVDFNIYKHTSKFDNFVSTFKGNTPKNMIQAVYKR